MLILCYQTGVSVQHATLTAGIVKLQKCSGAARYNLKKLKGDKIQMRKRNNTAGCIMAISFLLAMCFALGVPALLGLVKYNGWIIFAPLWVPALCIALVLIIVLAILVVERYHGRRPK